MGAIGGRLRPVFKGLALCALLWGWPASAEDSEQAAPAAQDTAAPFSADDELILELRIEGEQRSDTLVAFGRLPEIYLPFGLIARLLDLAVTLGPDGRFATGWVLDEKRTLSLEAGQDHVVLGGKELRIDRASVVAYDGEMYMRPETLEQIVPVEIGVDLRAQTVSVKTLATFPFQSQSERDRRRGLLDSQANRETQETLFPRQETPFRWYDIPKADVELRAVSDQTRGTRAEGEIYLAGDLAKASAELFLSASSRDGLYAALFQIGRDDPDGDLLGPLNATGFAVGDVQLPQQPIGLRSSFGRGFRVSNEALDTRSVFDRIDLRGVLQDGYEVELYRNGVLLGSTREAVNGQYEFLQVPVDFGLNAFRLVFYGPQGQQREEVRTISVGDGRLREGQFDYALGVVQNERTLIDVQPRGAIRRPDTGAWRAVANLAYGMSSDVTLVGSASFDQGTALSAGRSLLSAGARTGMAGYGMRFDAAFDSTGGFGAVAGINGQIGTTNFTLQHGEYGGGFIDEQRAFGRRPISRATDLNLTASIDLIENYPVPVVGRVRRLQFADGASEMRGSARFSTWISDYLVSNAFEYVDFSAAEGNGERQFLGTFDLATMRSSRFRGRASIEYSILPQAEPTAIGATGDWKLNPKTLLQFSAGYRLDGSSTSLGASALTRFGKSTLGIEGLYDLQRKAHSVSLRWGVSFGRGPDGFFLDEVSRARHGAVQVNAFYDRNADGIRDEDEEALPDLGFFSPSDSTTTDAAGRAVITGLPANRPTAIQIDVATIPDITLIPDEAGFEIVPRRGRTHAVDFPIVSIGEVEGTVIYVTATGSQPVGGVILGLEPVEREAEPIWLRSEADGYFYFEQVRPGEYTVLLDTDQAARLSLCLGPLDTVTVSPEGGTQTLDITVANCAAAIEQPYAIVPEE